MPWQCQAWMYRRNREMADLMNLARLSTAYGEPEKCSSANAVDRGRKVLLIEPGLAGRHLASCMASR